MKVIAKMVLLVLVLVGVGNYIVYLKTGKMPLKNVIADWQHEDVSQKIKNVVSASPAPVVKVYKWTDANGVVHYDSRPVKGAKLVEVNTNTNVLPPPEKVELPQPETKPQTADEQVRKLQDAKQAYFDSVTQ